jgi:hypothetical protein
VQVEMSLFQKVLIWTNQYSKTNTSPLGILNSTVGAFIIACNSLDYSLITNAHLRHFINIGYYIFRKVAMSLMEDLSSPLSLSL